MSRFAICTLICTLFCLQLYAVAEDALQLRLDKAREQSNLDLECTALIELGEYYLQSGNYLAAQTNFEAALALALKQKNVNDQVYIAVNLGNVHDLKSELQLALDYYKTALDKAQKPPASRYLSHIHNNMGNLYVKIGSFTQSLSHYQQALEIKRQQNNPAEIANALMNLSIYYLKTGNYERSMEYQKQALKLREELGNQADIAAVHSSISVCYRNLKNYPKAFEYNRKALNIYLALGNKAKIASAYNNLGVLYLATEDLPQAKENYLKSYAMKQDSQDLQSVLSTIVNLADISLKLGQLQEAKRYLNQGEEIVQKTQYYDLSRILFRINSEYNESSGNYRAALKHFKAYHSISDSLSSIENSRQLNELEIKYEVLEKERNIELLTRNNELTTKELKNTATLRNYLFLIIILILLMTLQLIWRYRSVLKITKELRASREKLNTLNTELEQRVEEEVDKRRAQEEKALRQSRLALLGELAAGISHELNQPMQTLSLTLENIKAAISDKDVDAAYLERKLAYLFEDIDRMHIVIDHIRRFSRPVDDEQDTPFDPQQSILNAIDLVKDRFAKTPLNFETELDETKHLIKGNPHKFEHVMLNLISNARDAIRTNIQNGIINTGIIRISCQASAQNLMIMVRDNGCGIAPELQDRVFELFFSTKNAEQGTGLGLAISHSTLLAMKSSLSLESKPPEGSCFTITIPCYKTQ